MTMYDARVARRLTVRALVVGLAVLVGLAVRVTPPAAAQPAPTARDGAAIALIPFTAEKRLRLYGTPVAAEITRALRAAGLDVTLVSDGQPVPPRARLVVDGRLVKRGAGVVIEARIRDPERGVDVARPSAAAPALGEIDRAAATVAAELVAAIRDGLAAQDVATARARAALVASPVDAPGPRPPDAPGVAVDRRPLAVVVVAGPPIAGADGARVDIAPLVAPAALELTARLGHRLLIAGAPDGGTIDVAAVRRHGAALVVTFELLGFTPGRQGDIPVARARARVTVYDAGGDVRYRRVVRTDTLIGSRGDRVDTMLRFVAAQVADVVTPRIRERLGAAAAARVPPARSSSR